MPALQCHFVFISIFVFQMLFDMYGVACSGDHTVKVICVRTGKCLQTLTGHRRTPWVVSQMTSVLWRQQQAQKGAVVQTVCAV